jgi:hypothetical protein
VVRIVTTVNSNITSNCTYRLRLLQQTQSRWSSLSSLLVHCTVTGTSARRQPGFYTSEPAAPSVTYSCPRYGATHLALCTFISRSVARCISIQPVSPLHAEVSGVDCWLQVVFWRVTPCSWITTFRRNILPLTLKKEVVRYSETLAPTYAIKRIVFMDATTCSRYKFTDVSE